MSGKPRESRLSAGLKRGLQYSEELSIFSLSNVSCLVPYRK